MYNKNETVDLSKNNCHFSKDSKLYVRASEARLSIYRRESNPIPISSFTNQPSVFYNPEHNKVFSKRFNLKKK